MAERRLEKFAEQFGGTLCRLDSDISGEPVGDDDVHCPCGNIVSFYKPVEMDGRDGTAQARTRAANRVVSLHVFRTDIEQPYRRLHKTKHRSGENISHQSELD